MDTTYLYTKRFIDQEVKRLGQPLEITPSLERILADQNSDDAIDSSGELSEKQLQQIIGKVNVLIKRHNRNIFPKQVINQIVQQVIKCEQNKLMIVNEKLMRIELILKPILLPEVNQMGNIKMLMGEFGTLVRELPESKYLLEDEDEDEEDRIRDEEDNARDQEESEEEHILVQDEQERLNDEELTKSQYTRQLKQRTERVHSKQRDEQQLLQQYDEIRHRLIQLHLGLEYKYAKLEYLNQLKQKLLLVLHVPIPQPVPDTSENGDDEPYDSDDEPMATSGSNQVDAICNTSLPNEINKFRVLVEKITYRLKSKDELHAALDSTNTQ